MTDTPGPAPIYLGDGVYASFDGWCVWLKTEREDGDHKIALEPEVFAALTKYAQRAFHYAEEPSE